MTSCFVYRERHLRIPKRSQSKRAVPYGQDREHFTSATLHKFCEHFALKIYLKKNGNVASAEALICMFILHPILLICRPSFFFKHNLSAMIRP